MELLLGLFYDLFLEFFVKNLLLKLDLNIECVILMFSNLDIWVVWVFNYMCLEFKLVIVILVVDYKWCLFLNFVILKLSVGWGYVWVLFVIIIVREFKYIIVGFIV